MKNDRSNSRFLLELHFLANIFLGKKFRQKMALKASKMNKRAIFTSFSLILAPKTALELIFAVACRIQCFVRKVSYDIKNLSASFEAPIYGWKRLHPIIFFFVQFCKISKWMSNFIKWMQNLFPFSRNGSSTASYRHLKEIHNFDLERAKTVKQWQYNERI